MTPGARDAQRDHTRAALDAWAREHKELISVCMACGDVYDHKSSLGSQGGLSHGLCPHCAERWAAKDP